MFCSVWGVSAALKGFCMFWGLGLVRSRIYFGLKS